MACLEIMAEKHCQSDTRSAKLIELSSDEQARLHSVANNSIAEASCRKAHHPPSIAQFPPRLRELWATFVTIRCEGELRGCVGTVEAIRALVRDVAHNAYQAAAADERFLRVAEAELAKITVSISILSPLEELQYSSESDLLQQLRPGFDGVLLREDFAQGTFLPVMWERLPERKNFLDQLKVKSGLPANYWSESLRVFRYTAQTVYTRST